VGGARGGVEMGISMQSNRKVPNALVLMVFLLICSLVVSASSVVLFMKERGRTIKLKNMLLVMERNMVNYKDSARRYQEFKEEREKWQESALDYLEWQFVLKDQVALAGGRLSENIKQVKDLKRNKDLINLLYYNLGLNYTLAMDFESAIRSYEDALRFNPRDFQSCYNLGLLYSTYRKNAAKAIHYYKKYLELVPVSPLVSDVEERILSLGKNGNTNNGVKSN
jgi:tetratricopeptide (TPR) repeat protein